MAQADSEVWKKKYYTSLERLEAQDARLADLEALMRTGIARLSLAAEGHDPAIDRELKKLRKLARDKHEPEELRAALDRLAETMRRHDSPRAALERKADDPAVRPATTATIGTPSAWQTFDALIADLHLPAADKAALARQRAAEAAGRAEQQWQALLRELSEIINRRLDATGVAPEAGSPATNAVLLELLNYIPLPPELAGRLETIRDRLAQSISAPDWPQVLNAIAELIAEMRKRIEAEKTELESFLVQITNRLKEIDASLQGAETERRSSYESGRDLDRAVQEQVNGIESSIQQSRTLDQLKSAIQGRIETIRTRMQTHRRDEERRSAELERRMQDMATRLHGFEREATELRVTLKQRRDQALLDALTGVPNRLAWDERLAQEVNRWRRYRTPLALLVLDVDFFKQINDNYGHKAGDKALQLIASVLSKGLRDTDFLARYGGEEFVALITNESVTRVADVAEKLRGAIEAADFHFRGEPVAITVSCGFATFRDADSADSVFQRADCAVYHAKAEGRNRCANGDEPVSG